MDRLDVPSARVIASAFALYFDLVNTAEDNFRIASLRQEALAHHPAPVHDSIEEAIVQLKNRGISTRQMAELLSRLQIEIVLTAHPTESRRRTILSKIERISDSLRLASQVDCLPSELERSHSELYNEITTLWLTDRSRTAQPTPTDEVKTTLYFVGEVFWDALPEITNRLEDSLAKHYPGLAVDHPWFRLASWIGGDRDGNPNVTARVTAETLHLHRGLALENHRRSLQDLSRRLSLSSQRVSLPDDVKTWLSTRNPLPPHAAQIQQRYPLEPFRLALSLLAGDLAEASQDDMKARLLSDAPHTARVKREDLAWQLQSLANALPPAIAEGPIKTVNQQLEIFGLHGARLDLREDSSRINVALGEVLRALGITPDFETQDRITRKELILSLLSRPKPALATYPGVSEAAHETWALFQLIARSRSIYGKELFGPFIISMTHGSADVLAVLLMATWSGCADGLAITPLFETIQDLAHASQVMEDLFEVDVYRTHLETCLRVK